MNPPSEAPRGTELAATLLREHHLVRVVAAGHSMSPFIRGGDALDIAPVAAPVRIGDVVAVATEGRLLVHRVVSTSPLATRGDVAEQPDPLFEPEVLGRVVGISRGARRIRFGLGPERILVAWASRLGLLRRLARIREGWRA